MIAAPAQVPQIFAKETVTASKSAINEVPFIPKPLMPTSVLSNLDLSTLPALLMYDAFDALLMESESVWKPEKWDAVWMKNAPPGSAWHPRDKALEELQQTRQSETKPGQNTSIRPVFAFPSFFRVSLV